MKRNLAVWLTIVILAAACSSSAVDSSEPVEESADAARAEPAATDIVGRWAHFDAVAYANGDFNSLIVSFGFNDFDEVDGEIIDSASFCFSEQITNQPISTTMSDAATQAIQPPSTPLDVTIDDGVLSIRRDSTPTPVGIRLDDPTNEALPTDPDDPRIVDDDSDGNPGITVQIDAGSGFTGELYIARREIFSYVAELTAADRIEGTVIDESEQLLIGASDPLFIQPGEFTQVDDPALNPVILQRVDSSWDCERLAAERNNLFPPTPAADW